MKNTTTPAEIEIILGRLGSKLPDEDKLYLLKHFKAQLKQSFVHGIMSGPEGNFDKYYEQKYGEDFKVDDHFGI